MISAINSSNAYNCNSCKRPSFGMFTPARVVVRKANRGSWDFYTLCSNDSRGARQSFIDFVKKAYDRCMVDKAKGADYRSTKSYDVLRKLHIIPDFDCKKPNINTTEIVTGSDTKIWALTGDSIDKIRSLGEEIYKEGYDPVHYADSVKAFARASKGIYSKKTGERLGLDIIVDEKTVTEKGQKVKKYVFADLDIVPLMSQYRQKPSKPMMIQGELF